MHENGAFNVSEYRVLPPVPSALASRGLRSEGLQVVLPHYFNTEENLDYLGSIPDFSYYGVNEMGDEFLPWYDS